MIVIASVQLLVFLDTLWHKCLSLIAWVSGIVIVVTLLYSSSSNRLRHGVLTSGEFSRLQWFTELAVDRDRFLV